MISEEQLRERLRPAEGDASADVHLVQLADRALRQARRQSRARTGAVAVVLSLAALGASAGGWALGDRGATPAPPAQHRHATATLSIVPVLSATPGPCSPGSGGTDSSSGDPTCYELARTGGMTVTAPTAVASMSANTGAWEIDVTLHGRDVATFAALTRSVLDHQLALVVDRHVLSAPTVASPMPGGQLVITGDFTQASATALARELGQG